ncbi:MAG: leucine-rich repeat domain-containing protein [Bacteroidales bacterium]|nr:leucine-rich repeat domain-containing protein [Bacteroidales bacterium]
MKKRKIITLSLMAAACAVCLCFALVACSGGGDDKADKYGYGEEGFYYYDGSDFSRYMLSLQSGTYMMTVNNTAAYSGSYSYDEDSGTVSFTGEDGFTAALGENALSLTMSGGGYSFKAYKFFEVTYVDETGKTVATESVLNGQCAEAPDIEKDGYWFIDWYEDAANSAVYSFDTSIAGDTVIYGWFIEKSAGATEHTVTLDYGDGVTEVWDTTNGAIYKVLPESHEERSIIGWWVSATNIEGELTYRYAQGDVLDSDTTLFAVYAANSVLAVSVTAGGITWDTTYTGANVTVTVYDSDGMRVLTDTVSSSTGIFSSSAFTGLGTGKYTVEVSSGNAKETRVYVVNGLSRVSLSESGVVENGSGRVLSFAPVEGADGYLISVTNGERSVTEDLGSRTYYNFSDWEMTKEGITFAVTAYGEGYVESFSDSYTYLKVLGGVTVSIEGDVVSWNRVDGALEYAVTISDVDGNVLDAFTTVSTSFSLKYYESGTYDITVRPRTDGYYSEAETVYGYAKESLMAPKITNVTGTGISWEGVGADYYVVMINGVPYGEDGTIKGTTLYFSDTSLPESRDGKYEISVKAVKTGGTDSPYSDAVVATEEFSSAVSYDRNTVYWNYDIEATSYGVSVNGGDEAIVTEGNSAKVTLTKAGDNTITVTAYRDGEAAGCAETTVYAYSVTLDPNGATLMSGAAVNGVVYVAQGDEMNLGTVEKDYADFVGWYTQADYTEGQSDVYEGKGSEVEDGSVFTGSHGMYVYAYWTYRYVDVTLVLGDGKLSDGTSGTVTVSVKYNSSTGMLPVPVPDDDIDDFVGWFADPNGNGTQYTNGLGEWTDSPYMGESMLYASYLTIFAYTKTQYNGQTVYAVSINSQVNISRFDDITIPESYDGCSLILNADAFAGCSTLVTINVPDTVLYISTTNDGYVMGTGAFSGCYNLQNVNIYATDGVSEPLYFSDDGVLFRKITSSSSGDAELAYYPYGRPLGSYIVPAVVYDECETDYNGAVVEHKVTSVAAQVFKDRKISSITISCNVTTVSSQAFYNNPYLKEVYFEPGGTDGLTIASYAFINCTSLTDVTLPSRCNSFDATAFEGCTALERMFVETGGTYSSTDDGTLLGDNGTTLVFYSTGRSGEVDISDISAGISKIEQNAFASNNKITSVVISKSVTEICASAFEGCKGVTSLVFEGDDNSPDLTIRTRAFYGCVSLTSVVLPSNLTALYVDAFGGCISLTYVEYDARADSSASSVNFVDGAFGAGNHITTLKLGEHVPEMDFAAIFDGGLISRVIIDENNPYYVSDQYGVVYGASSYNIIYCPPAISGDYVVLDGVTSVESGIFSDKIYLTSVTIGAGVNTIADDAFDGCVSLTAIYVDDDNSDYGNAKTLAGEKDGILYKKESGELVRLICCPMSCVTTDVTVEDSVTSVAMGAFSGVTTLESVSFENSGSITFEVVESGDDKGNANTFLNCTALTTVVLPENMTSVPAYMFGGCSSLKNIGIPSGVTVIELRAFSGCSSLTGDLTDPISGIKLPSGLITIDERAFSGCGNLAVTIPNTVTHIGSYAFYQCWYTKDAESEIVFEKGGTESLVISSYAFEYTIYCTGVEIPARATTVASYSFAYLGMSVYAEKDLDVRFEEGSELETLTDCFRYTVIKEISIPASVKTVSANVFYNNASLESVTFETDENGESSLNSIADSVFATSKITSVELPASLTTIGKSTFATSTLTSVTFADGSQLKTIGDTAFKGTAVEEIDIPSSVTSVGVSAFAGCTKLEKVTFEDGGSSALTKIGNSCFDGCAALTNVTLPGKLEQTGDGTASGIFNGCTALETITLPASVKTITADTFSGCVALTTVVFESGSALATIGDEAFVGCVSLSSAYTGSSPSGEGFVFPESTAATLSLGNAIFNGCTSLTHVTL